MALGVIQKFYEEKSATVEGLQAALKSVEEQRNYMRGTASCSTERERQVMELAFDLVVNRLTSDLEFALQMRRQL